MKNLYATVRIEKATGRPAVFYRNSTKHGIYGLSCYTKEEQHSDASTGYYRDNTRPARSAQEQLACDDLARHYAVICANYGGENLVIRARLQNN